MLKLRHKQLCSKEEASRLLQNCFSPSREDADVSQSKREDGGLGGQRGRGGGEGTGQ